MVEPTGRPDSRNQPIGQEGGRGPRDASQNLVSAELESHIEGMYRYAKTLTRNPDFAEDVCHTVIMRVLGQGKPDLTTYESLRPYLYTSVRREVNARRKRQGTKVRLLKKLEVDKTLEAESNPLIRVIAAERRRRLATAILDLSKKTRRAIELWKDGLPYVKMAKELGVSPNTASSWVKQGLNDLRKTLEEGAVPDESKTSPSK